MSINVDRLSVYHDHFTNTFCQQFSVDRDYELSAHTWPFNVKFFNLAPALSGWSARPRSSLWWQIIFPPHKSSRTLCQRKTEVSTIRFRKFWPMLKCRPRRTFWTNTVFPWSNNLCLLQLDRLRAQSEIQSVFPSFTRCKYRNGQCFTRLFVAIGATRPGGC